MTFGKKVHFRYFAALNLVCVGFTFGFLKLLKWDVDFTVKLLIWEKTHFIRFFCGNFKGLKIKTSQAGNLLEWELPSFTVFIEEI